MSTQLKVYGIMILGGLGIYGFSEMDKAMNYVETPAYVSNLEVDCFIEDSNSKVVEKATGNLAYMECEIAPVVAPMHGHDESDIQRRYKIEYTFQSPVDGKHYKGTKTTTSHAADKYKKDMGLMIYAHKEEAEKSRWN